MRLPVVMRRDSAPEGATARSLRDYLGVEAWLITAVAVIRARFAPGERAVRVAVTVREEDGTLACYTVGPAEGEVPVRYPADGGRP